MFDQTVGLDGMVTFCLVFFFFYYCLYSVRCLTEKFTTEAGLLTKKT